MSAIHNDVDELKSLGLEIKSIRAQLKALQSQKTACENRIINYLDANDMPGAKYNNSVIMVTQKAKRAYQKKSEKLSNGEDVLRRYGIHDASGVITELLDAMRGPSDTISTLKMM